MGLDLKRRATLHRLEKILSMQYGIANSMLEMRHKPIGFYPWNLYWTSVPEGKDLGIVTNDGGASASQDHVKTAIGALGETVERYCLSITPLQMDRLFDLSYDELRKKKYALAPEDYPLYAESQFQSDGFLCKPWTHDLKLDWVRAYDWNKKKDIWLPEDFASYGKPVIYRNTSNGCAVGETFESTAVPAILELVERDSFMGFWWNKISPPQIDKSKIQNAFSQNIIRYFDNTSQPVFLLDGTSDLEIPVVFAAYKGDVTKSQPPFFVAAAAGLTIEAAVTKALSELAQFASHGDDLTQKKSFTDNYDKEINNFEDCVDFYVQPENFHLVEFFLQGSPSKRDHWSERARQISKYTFKDLIEHFRKKGYRLLTADLTTRDIRQLGFLAIRTLIPGLIPLNGQHQYRTWGIKRIYEFKSLLDNSSGKVTEKDLYPFPHPFP